MPSEFFRFGDVEELAGGAVGTGGVPEDAALIAHHLGHELGEGFDGELLAGAGIHGLVAAVVIHEEHAEVGQVIDIEELAQGAAIAPAGDGLQTGLLGLVETADEGRQHVAVLGMVVIVGPVEVGGHHGDVVRAVLAVEELAILEAGDLGQGVGLVGLLQRAGEQAALGHGLGRHAGIDAAGTQELELAAAVLPGGMDDVHLQNHVVVHEVGQRALVGHDAAHLGGCQEHVLRTLLCEEGLHLVLTGEVQLPVRAGDDIGVALPLQFADNGTSHHAPVSGYVNLTCFFHYRMYTVSSFRLQDSCPSANMLSSMTLTFPSAVELNLPHARQCQSKLYTVLAQSES